MEILESKMIFPTRGEAGEFFTADHLTEEEQMIAQTVSQFVDEDILPYLKQIEQHDYDLTRKLFTAAGELGLMGVEVPEDYGGLELGKKMSGIIAEKMGYAASFSVAFNIHSGVGLLPYVYYGTDYHKQTFVPKLVSGEWIGAYALTEPNAGSDALAARTRATWDEESQSWTLTGEKQWITNAHVAQVFVVFANTNEGITAFIVTRDQDGVSVGPEEKKLGIQGSSTATLILDRVNVPNKHVLGTVGKGHYIALNILNVARLKLAFSNIGMAKQALEIAIQYGKEREQFSTKLINFPLIQEKIAEMAIGIYGAESMAYYTAGLLDQVSDSNNLSVFAMDCAMNKVASSEMLHHVVDETLQIHGGYGFMEEYAIARMYRDARINRIFEGTNEINRLTVAKAFFKQNQTKPLAEFVGENDRNSKFINESLNILNMILEKMPLMDREAQDKHQDQLGVIADMLIDIYRMKAAYYRAQSHERADSIHQWIVSAICEEGFQRIKTAANRLIAALEIAGSDQALMVETVKNCTVPMYSNLFLTKRKIAEHMIATEKYKV
ncbi:MAG TPA: acyl-CoA dehydrogenase family protein [Cerasibacillus sp.]